MHHATKSRAPYIPSETPRAGTLVWLSPSAGYHRAPHWALIVASTDGIVSGTAYITTVPIDDINGGADARQDYVTVSGLLCREVD